MGSIVVTTNVSLDGVVQDPDGQEGFTRGGWFGQFGGEDLQAWAELKPPRQCAHKPCCWAVAVTSGSRSGGHHAPVSGQTG